MLQYYDSGKIFCIPANMVYEVMSYLNVMSHIYFCHIFTFVTHLVLIADCAWPE